ncbi:hypothetical protein QFC19_004574 [Naganishia cerealis]|uniref:Uncharacterized protein n=1 Tax=Naganishia cerealis TaxID=610337 RepID=A0ACC2VUP2_9TREE|nr:hypothetical protein QFC19_004574 [Naganishia cerealis]
MTGTPPPPTTTTSSSSLDEETWNSARVPSLSTASDSSGPFAICSTPHKQSLANNAQLCFDSDLTCNDLEESFNGYDSGNGTGFWRARQSIASLGGSSCGSAGGPSTPHLSRQAFENDEMSSPRVHSPPFELGHFDLPVGRSEQHKIGIAFGHESGSRVFPPELWEGLPRRTFGTNEEEGQWVKLQGQGKRSGRLWLPPTEMDSLKQRTDTTAADRGSSSVAHHSNGEISGQTYSFESAHRPFLLVPPAADLADWGDPEILDGCR